LNVLRGFYLAVVFFGLYINIREWKHAKWLCQELKDLKINGDRQDLAEHLRGEELMRVWIMSLLAIPAITGLIVRARPRPQPLEIETWHIALMVVALLAHISMVVLLAWKSWRHRAKRKQILDDSQHGKQVRKTNSEATVV
jgi:cytochrome b subunit of formate dehydrogenase